MNNPSQKQAAEQGESGQIETMFLQADQTGFADESNVGCERKKEPETTPSLGCK